MPSSAARRRAYGDAAMRALSGRDASRGRCRRRSAEPAVAGVRGDRRWCRWARAEVQRGDGAAGYGARRQAGAGVDDGRERCADLEQVVADGHEELADDAVVEDLHLDVGLVGLDHRDEIAAVDRVAGLHEPFEEPALGHVGAERRHAEHARLSHGRSSVRGRDHGAATVGSAASSRCFAYGIGTSALQTRSTGASRSKKACSAMRAAISAEIEPLRQPSSTITARCVRRTDSMIVSSSSGPQGPQVDHVGFDAVRRELRRLRPARGAACRRRRSASRRRHAGGALRA